MKRTNGGDRAWVNYAEIASFYDLLSNFAFDADSNPNSDTNQERDVLPGSPNDNNLNSTGLANNDDDDDHDPASINIFDLALTKTQGSALLSFSYLQEVEYVFTIYNQGSIPATSIEITDYLSPGLQYMATPKNAARGWIYDAMTNKAKATYNKILLPGQSDTLKLDLMPIQYYVDPDNAWTDYAEISSADDTDPQTPGKPVDLDSTPDSINGNDAGGKANSPSDNALNGDGTGVPGDAVAATDEDDHDVHKIQIFDLALRKTKVTPGQYFKAGDDVTFNITIFNQGNVAAKNIVISDYIASGFAFIPGGVNAGWSGAAPLVSFTIVPTLFPNTNTTISITLKVQASAAANAYFNYAEISVAMDTLNNGRNDDADSKADNNPANDNQVLPGSADDDNILGNSFTGGDEDDHDVAGIEFLCERPTLTVGIPECDPGNGTYSVTYYSNVTLGNISASSGTVGASKVTGILLGTNVTITATNGANCSQSLTVVSPASCPGTGGCAYPETDRGTTLCGTSTWSVSFSTDIGIVSTTFGTVSGNSIINIPFGQNITVTATNGNCISRVNLTAPTNCGVPCANSPVSISGPVCETNGAGTYSVNFIVAAGTTVQASQGILNAPAGTVTGIPTGVNLTLTVTTPGCTTRTIVVPAGNCPVCERPTLTVGIPECDPGNGTYSVTYYSNVTLGNISASSGTVGASKVTGILLGTNVTITATNGANCSQSLTVVSPASCPGTGGCAYPKLTVGQPLCGTSTWSVSFSTDIGIVSTTFGTLSGNSIINIPFGQNITVTATNGNCISRVNVTAPTNCGVPCANSPISISGPVCETNGAGTYSVNFIVASGTTVQASQGVLNAPAGTVTGIPTGVNLTLTVTTPGCLTRTIVVPAGNCPVCERPTLTVGIPECDPGNGTYSVTYYSNVTLGNISASSGTVGASKVTGILIGTNVTITATNGANCSQSLTVVSPASCPGTGGCAYPKLTVGQPLCGTSTWSVSFSTDIGIVSTTFGTLSGRVSSIFHLDRISRSLPPMAIVYRE
ncbi:MAG: DUF11 domain-containing protein [Saprospiraceae bacterium]|nr:DUF11 domain-containing protein [Saprospiraceae bacterium]